MVFVFLGYGAVIMAGVMVGTMIADLTDEHELATSMRQEGLLFSANTFMVVAASGVGVMLAGFVLKLIGLPKGAMPETIDVQTVTNLGIAEATLLFVLGALASVFFSGYRLDREQHAAIAKELRARRLS